MHLVLLLVGKKKKLRITKRVEMDAKEFIHRIIQLSFDKKIVDSYAAKWDTPSGELKEIRQNSVVIQWYATQAYISARTVTDRLSEKESALLTQMYDSQLFDSDFETEENGDFRSEVFLKIAQQKEHYDAVCTINGICDIMGHRFIRKIGECFARINNRPDSVEFKRLGSDLFGNCLNKCISEFKFEKIEFMDSTAINQDVGLNLR